MTGVANQNLQNRQSINNIKEDAISNNTNNSVKSNENLI